MKILKLNSSGNTYNSVTRFHVEKVIDRLTSENASASVTDRDLVKAKLPHIDMEFISAAFAKEALTPQQVDALAISNSLVDELLDHDVLVIGAPMYNFGTPAALKAYIDLIARAGRTFTYGENGPEGLIEGKKAYVVISTGGTPIGSAYDFLKGYMQTVLSFLGVKDIQFVIADEMGSPEDKNEKAEEKVAAL